MIVKRAKPVNVEKKAGTHGSGGRQPMTAKRMIPIVVVIDLELWELIEERVIEFVNPITKKPYGISALCRILVSEGIEHLSRIKAADLLDYLPSAPKGAVGRFSLSGRGTVKLAIALKKSDIETINARVPLYDSKLIGTSTIVRYLIRRAILDFDINKIYRYIPDRHKNEMIEAGWTVQDLQAQYRKRLRRKPLK